MPSRRGMTDNVGAPVKNVRGLCPRDWIRWVVDASRTHRGKRGCCRSSQTSAANDTRQSHGHGAPRTVHPTGGSVSNAAGYDAADTVAPRLTNGARAVPAGLDTLGCGRKAGAPWVTRVRLVTPDGCG